MFFQKMLLAVLQYFFNANSTGDGRIKKLRYRTEPIMLLFWLIFLKAQNYTKYYLLRVKNTISIHKCRAIGENMILLAINYI